VTRPAYGRAGAWQVVAGRRSFFFVVQPLPGRQQLNFRAGGHQALALVKHLVGVSRGVRHHRYPDLGPPMQVKVTCLGDRDAGEPAAQLGDNRPDDGPLLLERADIAKQHVER